MDASSNVGEFRAWREFFCNVDLPGGLHARIEQWIWTYKYGITNVARSRFAELAEAVEKGDFAKADTLLCGWGIR